MVLRKLAGPAASGDPNNTAKRTPRGVLRKEVQGKKNQLLVMPLARPVFSLVVEHPMATGWGESD